MKNNKNYLIPIDVAKAAGIPKAKFSKLTAGEKWAVFARVHNLRYIPLEYHKMFLKDIYR